MCIRDRDAAFDFFLAEPLVAAELFDLVVEEDFLEAFSFFGASSVPSRKLAKRSSSESSDSSGAIATAAAGLGAAGSTADTGFDFPTGFTSLTLGALVVDPGREFCSRPDAG